MSKVEKMCQLAIRHTVVELNLDAMMEYHNIERDDPRFIAAYQRVLAAREKFHASIIEAQVEVSEIQRISLTQAEAVVKEALDKAYYKSYCRRRSRGVV